MKDVISPAEHLQCAHVDLTRLDSPGVQDPTVFKLQAIRAGLHIAAALVSHLIEKDSRDGRD